MPGRHNPEKLQLRRERTRLRGFLVTKPSDVQFVAVDPELAPRVKAVAASLSVHADHNALSGQAPPYARQATRAARDLLPPLECTCAMRLHDKANLAKHRWDTTEVDFPAPALSPPLCGASASPASSSSPPPSRGVNAETQTNSDTENES